MARICNTENYTLNNYLPVLVIIGNLSCVAIVSADEALYDLPLDQIVNVEVSSASRFMQKSSEAPSAVEVLTAKDISSYGWRTLADALNSIRGLYIRNDRNYTFIGTRGFSHTGDYNSRMLIMVDGRRMNDAAYDSGFMGEEFMLDMNLIERIEYIPGSGSSVYGSNALLGVVNVITKQGKDFDGAKLTGETGSQGVNRIRGTYGKKFENGVDLLLNGSEFYSRGQDNLYFPEFATTHGGVAPNMDQERSTRVFTQLSYRDLTFRGGMVDRFKQVPTASFGSIFADRDYHTVDRSSYVDLDYNTQVNDHLGLEVRGFHHWYDYHALTPQDLNAGVGPLLRVVNYDAANTRWWGGEFKLTGTQFENHKWVSGVEFQYDAQQQLLNYNINPYQVYNNSSRQGWRSGVYVQDEYRLTENLLLNAGVRLDQNHMIDGLQLNPRVGLIWDATSSLTGKLIYSSAFRAPNLFERDASGLGNTPNPYNRQELIKSYEAITEWRPGNGVKLLGTVFYNNLEKVLTQDNNSASATYGMFVNLGAYHTYGFEFQAEKKWDNERLLKLSWTHTDMQSATSNGFSWAPDSPNNLVKFHYAEPFLDNKLRLGFEELFIDQRRTLANNIAPSYHLFNINLASTKPIYGFKASLGVYNVLDQHYKIVGGIQNVQDTLAMDGRTARFRLEYGF